MMNSPAIWKAIVAAPGDENLKAQYIEALEGEGDARAEMFRLDVEIARLKGIFQIYKAEELMPRRDALLSGWRADFDSRARTRGAEVKFVKCWPIEVTISAGDFSKHAADIVTMLPLRHLNLTDVSESPEVFDVAEFAQIATLDGSNQPWSTEAVSALARSTRVQLLRWLDLSNTGMTEAQVEVMAGAARLRGLEHVDLTNNPSRDPVDAAAGYGVDWESNGIIRESIHLPDFGRELESRHGRIGWLHFLDEFGVSFPRSRYLF